MIDIVLRPKASVVVMMVIIMMMMSLCSKTAMNALAFLFQYKKLRRSSRLEVKANDVQPKSEDNNDDDQGSIGLFQLLPLELKFHIFTYLSGTVIRLVV